jgi:O-6-methylguanine DNA methyltransferase
MKRDAVYKVLHGLLPGYDVVAALTHRAVAALLIGRRPEPHLASLSSNFDLKPARGDRRFDRLADALRTYVRLGRDFRLELPLDYWWARPFEMAVYKILRRTVAGETIGYGEIARRIDSPRHARAVGRALGRNRILIAVPCHRVVRADRSLGGFTGGLDLKSRLLALERVNEEADALV